MITTTHRPKAYAVVHFTLALLAPLFWRPAVVHAQDTVSLTTVEVHAPRNGLSQFGKRMAATDSLTLEQYRFGAVSDILSLQPGVYIKSYGAGALATTAFRGGNASQTAVMWNGFNLQNAMLGQTDLALMPSLLFESVEVEYGGSSSLWGSGAVGGSIHLDNRPVFDQGLKTRTGVAGGSFGTRNAATSVAWSNKRFITTTKAYLNSSENSYLYTDALDPEKPLKRQADARYNFKGLMQELKMMLNQRQLLGVNVWLSSNRRHLPDYGNTQPSRRYQLDEALRATANWTYIKEKYKSLLRGAYFNDRIDYTDSASGVFSKSLSRTLMLENENYRQWGRNHQFSAGCSFQSAEGSSDYYSRPRTIYRVSLLAGNRFSFFNNRLGVYFGARSEYYSAGRLPVTGNFSLEYRALDRFVLGLNAARVYRQPTLNELYWTPGGNSGLQPEEGYTMEGNLCYNGRYKKLFFSLSGSVYSRRISNWILWVPGAGGNPSPLNVQEVWSRGSETSWDLSIKPGKWTAGVRVSSAYVLSTVSASAQENNNSVGRQLIYTPRYAVNGTFYACYRQSALGFYTQYTGYRFTSSDNSAWLEPYTLVSLRLSQGLSVKRSTLSFYLSFNNLFNVNYNVVAARPMPLRNYEAGIEIKINSKKNKYKEQP